MAERIETVLEEKLEATIETDNRYIICSVIDATHGTPNDYAFYLRLRLWEGSGERAGRVWVKVDYMVLSPWRRGQGKGKRIVELLKEWVQGQGRFDCICLYARPERLPFWERCGFGKAPDGERMEYWLKGSGWRDTA